MAKILTTDSFYYSSWDHPVRVEITSEGVSFWPLVGRLNPQSRDVNARRDAAALSSSGASRQVATTHYGALDLRERVSCDDIVSVRHEFEERSWHGEASEMVHIVRVVACPPRTARRRRADAAAAAAASSSSSAVAPVAAAASTPLIDVSRAAAIPIAEGATVGRREVVTIDLWTPDMRGVSTLVDALSKVARGFVPSLDFVAGRTSRLEWDGAAQSGRCRDGRAREILVLINPASGSGRASAVFETVLRPLLDAAQLSYRTLETVREGHAAELVQTLPLQVPRGPRDEGGGGASFDGDEESVYDDDSDAFDESVCLLRGSAAPSLASASDFGGGGAPLELDISTSQSAWGGVQQPVAVVGYSDIVVVGGDGLLHEVVQGLMARDDWRAAIKLPIGILPAGSGNGLAKSMLYQSGEEYDALSAAFLIARGAYVGADLATVEWAARSATSAGAGGSYGARVARMPLTGRRTSILSLAWAFVGDVDFESERYRCCGGLRFTCGALARLCCLRRYSGRLQWLPPAAVGAPPLHQPAADAGADAGDGDARSDGVNRPLCEHLPPLADNRTVTLPHGWSEEEGEFLVFWASLPSHAASDMHTAPSATLGDGLFHIVTGRGMSSCALFRAFVAIEEGGHAAFDGVEIIRARAFRLVPSTNRDDLLGYLSLDGEPIPYGTVQAETHRGLANVICAPPPQHRTAPPSRILYS